MISVILLWTFCFHSNDLYQTQKLPANDLITIYGSCFDVLTGIDLKIKAAALFNQRKLSLGESNNSGTFEFQIPDSTQFLSFEIAGYNTTIIPVNMVGKIEKGSKFNISVPMIAKDSQQISRVYQSPIQTKQASDPIKLSVGSKKVSFEVKDAHIGQLIKSKICLNYTQTGQTKCYDLDSKSSSLVLNQQDKIAFIISADGYQDYIGNLINDAPEHQEEFHRIKLLRSVNPLCLYYNVPDSLEVNYVITRNQTVATSFTYQSGKHPTNNYLYFIKPGQYQFTASTTDGIVLMNDKITTQPGFNFKTVHLIKPKSKIPEISKKPEIPEISEATNENVKSGFSVSKTLYFDQSSYILRSETKASLDSLCRILSNKRDLVINVTGYSDNVGKRNLNLQLSEYRARVVVNYLKQKGIPENQISFTWKGSDAPVVPNDNEGNKVRNRRVEVWIK